MHGVLKPDAVLNPAMMVTTLLLILNADADDAHQVNPRSISISQFFVGFSTHKLSNKKRKRKENTGNTHSLF